MTLRLNRRSSRRHCPDTRVKAQKVVANAGNVSSLEATDEYTRERSNYKAHHDFID